MKIELWWVSWPEVYSSKKQKKQMEKKKLFLITPVMRVIFAKL